MLIVSTVRRCVKARDSGLLEDARRSFSSVSNGRFLQLFDHENMSNGRMPERTCGDVSLKVKSKGRVEAYIAAGDNRPIQSRLLKLHQCRIGIRI